MLLGGVLSILLDQSTKSSPIASDNLGDILSLLLKLIILSEVSSVLILVRLEDFILRGVVLDNLHQFLDAVKLLVNRDTLSHNLILLKPDFIQLVKSILGCDDDWVLRQVVTSRRCRDHLNHLSARFAEQLEVLFVCFVFLGNRAVDRCGLAHLLLVVLNLLAVGSVDSSTWHNRSQVNLLAHLIVLLLLLVDRLLNGSNNVLVYLNEAAVGGRRLSEVLGGTLLLEILDFYPQFIRDLSR